MLETFTRSGQHRGMKKQISVVLAVTAAALLGGCAMFEQTGQSALVGTWTNSLGTVWAIKADGTFDVDLEHHKTGCLGNLHRAGRSGHAPPHRWSETERLRRPRRLPVQKDERHTAIHAGQRPVQVAPEKRAAALDALEEKLTSRR